MRWLRRLFGAERAARCGNMFYPVVTRGGSPVCQKPAGHDELEPDHAGHPPRSGEWWCWTYHPNGVLVAHHKAGDWS